MRIRRPDFSRVKAVSFDLDDTLWPVQPVLIGAEAAVYRVLEERFPAVSDACDADCLQTRRMAFFRARPDLKHDLSRLRRLFFEALLREFGYASGSTELLEVFLDHRNHVAPYPGCEALLDALAERYPLVACTNGNANVFKTPLARYFSKSIRSEETGAAKPAASIFDQTCQAVTVRPPELAHVGDNTIADVMGCQRFGCHGVWYNPQRLAWPHANEPAPHADVPDYATLGALLLA